MNASTCIFMNVICMFQHLCSLILTAAHQLRSEDFMYNDRTGVNTAMICMLYITEVIDRYETEIVDTLAWVKVTKAQHVLQMDQLRAEKADMANTDTTELRILLADATFASKSASQTPAEKEQSDKDKVAAAMASHISQQKKAWENEYLRIQQRDMDQAAAAADSERVNRNREFARRRLARRSAREAREADAAAATLVRQAEAEAYRLSERLKSHGVLSGLPPTSRFFLTLLILLLIIAMSTVINLMTVLEHSSTNRKLRKALLACVLAEGCAWLLWMCIKTAISRIHHPDLPWFFSTPIAAPAIAAPLIDPTATEAHRPTWCTSLRIWAPTIFCIVFILGAAPVLSNYMLLALFFWDLLWGAEYGLPSPCLVPGWQSTHLVLLKMCMQGGFIVIPSLVVSKLVMTGTSCPLACKHPVTGVSICSTDTGMTRLQHSSHCTAATCGAIFHATAPAAMNPLCFLDTIGSSAALSALVLAVLALVTCAGMIIAALLLRVKLTSSESYRVLITDSGFTFSGWVWWFPSSVPQPAAALSTDGILLTFNPIADPYNRTAVGQHI